MEDITDADYAHAKRVCKTFEIKNLGEYHDLYVQSDTLLLSDVFGNFINMYLEIYGLDPGKFLSAPGLAWQAALKKTKVRLDLLNDIYMLLMVENIREGIWYSFYQYARKVMIKKKSSYIQYWDVNDLYGWAMSQKLPLNNYEWIKGNSKFNEDFIENYNESNE